MKRIILTIISLCIIGQTSVSAANLSTGWYSIYPSNNAALRLEADNETTSLKTPKNISAQKFYVKKLSDGTYKIGTGFTGGVNAIGYDKRPQKWDNQKWTITPNGNYYTIKNKSKYLSFKGKELNVGDTASLWRFQTYSDKYTVHFKEGKKILKRQSIKKGESATAPTLPAKTGYTFAGWDKSFSNITSNITVTAKYTPKKIKVTFNKNDGTNATYAENYTYDMTNKFGMNLKDKTGNFGTWKRLGYKLLGWGKDKNTKKYTIYSDVSNAWINTYYPSINLYAIWEPKTDFEKVNNSYVYYKNGTKATNTDVVNGTINNVRGWYYIKNGTYDPSYTGFAKNSNGIWWIEKGKVTFEKTDVLKATYNGKEAWWNVSNSKLTTGPTVAKNEHGWWYIDKEGKVDFSFSGVSQNTHGWWYCENGKINFSTQDVKKLFFKGTTDWHYIHNGQLQENFTGLASNSNGTWYFKNGKIQWDFNGNVKYNNFTYKIQRGESIDFSLYGVKNGRKTYIIGDSRTAQGFSSMYKPELWGSDGKPNQKGTMAETGYAIKGLEIWKALGGSKYAYMEKALDYIKVDNVTDIIILSGVNDLWHEKLGDYTWENKYIAKINAKTKEFKEKGARVYYASVTPCAATRTTNSTRKDIDKIKEWNNYIKSKLNAKYIDIKISDFKTYDTVHFYKNVNIEIFKYILSHK